MKLEVCIDNIDDVLVCNKYSDIVSRVELNQGLGLGGLSPSLEFVKEVRKQLDKDIDLVCMIRPRAGDFYYSDMEFEIMINHAKQILNYCDGIVFGFLDINNNIDKAKTKKMIELAHKNNKEAIFHRAIDVCSNYFKALKELEKLKIDRVLTSGHEKTAIIGLENIKRISVDYEVLVGCGINEDNIHLFKDYHVHGSFSTAFETDFGMYQRLSEEKLDKIRESKIFKKSNTIFIHGAGINSDKNNGDSIYELIDNPNLVNFRYNQNTPIIKDLQNFFDVQIYGTDAVEFLVNYKFNPTDLKYVCGHSVGAFNVLKAFGSGYVDYMDLFKKKFPQNVDFIELGAPRIDEITSYIDEVAKRAKFVLIELIEDDKLEIDLEEINSISAIQYGDRSVLEFEKEFKDKKLPDNVFVLKINKVKTDSKEYLANVLLNHSLLFKKNSEINKKIQRIRLEFLEIIKSKDKFLTYKAKLRKLKELELEFNSEYLDN